ncbi:thiopeptide-type bacteriocin biosynthesis protein [Streptomyces sp. NPDC020490]|uniref:thiopeptide-type bacteriocin biosynthesis protein n=1 Tax=Streptomyces sp. NPDC020490 TaxID=3365078 RepID=UPI00378ADE8F
MEAHGSGAMEEAVLSVLAGTTVEAAAEKVRIPPAHLADAVKLYREAGRAALEARFSSSGWHQIHIEFVDYPTAERAFQAYVLPSLHGDGPVGPWWFVRKYPCWRLRVRPRQDASVADAAKHLTGALNDAVSWGVVRRWWPSLYEQETAAFGGPEGMRIAHGLFHTDSVGVCEYLSHKKAQTPGLPDGKTASFLVVSVLLRAAGLEWSEQGDVWARVEASRPLPGDIPTDRITAMAEPLRRILAVDAAPVLQSGGALATLDSWATGMQNAGRALGEAAQQNRLSLGIRRVLARHVLFHWNRMGFTTDQQAVWARAAREAILGD